MGYTTQEPECVWKTIGSAYPEGSKLKLEEEGDQFVGPSPKHKPKDKKKLKEIINLLMGKQGKKVTGNREKAELLNPFALVTIIHDLSIVV